MKILPLNIRAGNPLGLKCLVDDEDFDYLNNWNWHSEEYRHSGKYYVVRGLYLGGGKKKPEIKFIRLHREIMEAPKWCFVDHIDGNGLNNQKLNLRLCNNQQNIWNSPKSLKRVTSSKFKGVTKCRQTGLWSARLVFNGSGKWLGRHENENDAALAYNEGAKKYFGEFAYLNLVEN